MSVSTKKPSPWLDLVPRVASAMALGPLVLGAIWLGGLYWQVLLTLLAAVAAAEWVSLCGLKLDSPPSIAATVTVPAAQVAYLMTHLAWAPAVVIALMGNVLAWSWRTLGMGLLYIGAGYVSLLLLRERAGGHANLLFLLLVVWANDIGAYLAGRTIGGRRMAPKLSPGKTWAGAGGGLVWALFAGLGVALFYHTDQPGQFRAEGLAAAIAVLAQAGDLLESAMKRRFGRKDSGGLIPGHGGILDRVDGLLAAAPPVLAWQFLWHGPTLWQ
ncbi:MAG TPA: phosphatidate cytidylyltransferase [Acetobacteraceae bacterium]|nr:phosphatidate cytidylyltransferase [Acetobacteraceae bacterium]